MITEEKFKRSEKVMKELEENGNRLRGDLFKINKKIVKNLEERKELEEIKNNILKELRKNRVAYKEIVDYRLKVVERGLLC